MDDTERTPPAPSSHRRFLILTSAAISLVVLAGSLVWTARTLQANRLNRWLPERSGGAVVLEKTKRGDDCLLQIRLNVPAASPTEASFIPEGVNGRDAMLAARTFDTAAHVDQAQWDAAEPGMRVRAVYHINAGRSKVFVPTLYLDAMDSGAAPE